MAPWVMTSQVTKAPWLLTFSIGALPVALIYFENKKPVLETLDRKVRRFDSVSDAMKQMHELLNSPPLEPQIE